MGLILTTNISALPVTSIAFSRARSRPTCPCRRRPSTSWSSISRPPGRSASKFRPRCSPAARAQQPGMPVIGLLHSASPGPFAHLLAAYLQGLKDVGYVEDQNLAVEYRWAEGQFDRLPSLAADLIRRDVRLIAALGGSANGMRTGASRRQDRTSSELLSAAGHAVGRSRMASSRARGDDRRPAFAKFRVAGSR